MANYWSNWRARFIKAGTKLKEPALRPLVSVAAAVVVIGAAGIVIFAVVDGPPSDGCEIIRAVEEQESRDALIPGIRQQLDLDLQVLNGAFAERDGFVASESGSEGDADRQKELTGRVQGAVAQVDLTRRVLLQLHSESIDALLFWPGELDSGSTEAIASHENDLAAELAEWEALDAKLLSKEIQRIETTSLAAELSPVNLQPDGSLEPIRLGSGRGPKRQEITLITSDGVLVDQPGGVEGEVARAELRLPDQATYLTGVGQFVSEAGNEISRSDITVWTRRLGSSILLSLCIGPDQNLAAGTYTGKAYVVDPSLNTVQVPVEVTAQFKHIDWLYLLLLILPFVAMVYVWYTTHQPVGDEVFNPESFINWASQSFIVLFGIGFASVWATLQVAFNNPTWGSSLFGSAAVIGGGVVAAVTAMTTVGGRFRAVKSSSPPSSPPAGPPDGGTE